jgi:hypothetical protein
VPKQQKTKKQPTQQNKKQQVKEPKKAGKVFQIQIFETKPKVKVGRKHGGM